jgi:hypothetical protein
MSKPWQFLKYCLSWKRSPQRKTEASVFFRCDGNFTAGTERFTTRVSATDTLERKCAIDNGTQLSSPYGWIIYREII